MSPQELHFGKSQVDHVRKLIEYQVIQKFFHLYEGPYTITSVIGNNAFILSTRKGKALKGTYNRTSIRKYVRAAVE